MFHNFELKKTDEGRIEGYLWDVEDPAGVVCIVHGIGEYGGNSTGLGALLFVNKKFREANGIFKVANVNENVLEIIEIIGADQLLEIHGTLDDALASIR